MIKQLKKFSLPRVQSRISTHSSNLANGMGMSWPGWFGNRSSRIISPMSYGLRRRAISSVWTAMRNMHGYGTG